jgi:uncharacterized protein YcgL (UPF0745 family)
MYKFIDKFAAYMVSFACGGRTMPKDTSKSPESCFLIAENCETYLYIVDVSKPGMSKVLEDPVGVTECLYKNFGLKDRRLIVQDETEGVWEIIHSKGQFLTLHPGHDGIDAPSLMDIITYQLDLMDDFELRNIWEYIKANSFG